MCAERKTNRRTLIASGAKAVAGTIAGLAAARTSAAAGHEFYAVAATTESKCATCAFWGGVRRLSDDRKQVLTQSLGWCNNPASPRYGKLTTPETGPMDSWKKWDLIP